MRCASGLSGTALWGSCFSREVGGEGNAAAGRGASRLARLFAYFEGEILDWASTLHRDILMRTALLSEVSPRLAIARSYYPSAPDVLRSL